MTAISESTSILCDDIRTETGNKVSLMGVYGREIRVAGTEAVLPRLNLYKRLSATNPLQCSALLDLIGPDEKSVLPHTPPRLDDIKLSGEVNLGLGVGPLRLKDAGEYNMRLTLESPGIPDLVLNHHFVLTLNHK